MSAVDGQIGASGESLSSEPHDLRLDADFSFGNGLRVVQLTSSGSQCSVQFGTHITAAPPGSGHGLYRIVSDIEAGRDQLVNRGAEVTEVFHSGAPGAQLVSEGAVDRVSGPDPDHQSYNSFATLDDADGNSWLLQEATGRFPGRVDSTTAFSAGDLAAALRRAASAHGVHEQHISRADADWPDWYAEYMAREQSGEELPG